MTTAATRQRVRESFSRLPGHLVRRVHQVATAYFAEECGADLTAVQYAALVAIGAHPGIDATRLSEIIFFDRSTIGDVLDRMEGKGWSVKSLDAAHRLLNSKDKQAFDLSTFEADTKPLTLWLRLCYLHVVHEIFECCFDRGLGWWRHTDSFADAGCSVERDRTLSTDHRADRR